MNRKDRFYIRDTDAICLSCGVVVDNSDSHRPFYFLDIHEEWHKYIEQLFSLVPEA